MDNILKEISMPQTVILIASVIVILWRMTYGFKNGVLEEITGIISVVSALIALYLSVDIFNNIKGHNFEGILSKVINILIAVAVYKIVHLLGTAFRPVKEIPILGSVDRLAGMILGFVEACVIIFILQNITEIEIISLTERIFVELCTNVRKLATNL
ncbi:MAG: CvpA family protein [Butyrivibrio sp.]|nr:CvpA family protein [Butyrivibrio sp.]